ncbi:hypothetical protein C8J57DRAFT_1234996 [Mycena rebaudengoi]|nr:hypothetical protein C8J57DRAFT_1234996 [Mycena rebaudengoi]
MRSFFTATFLLGLLTHFALAVPVESDETYPLWLSVEVPGFTHVLASPSRLEINSLCSERNFEGTCIVEHATIGQCTSLPGAFTAQSFGPDAGLTCFVFDQANCTRRSVGPIINGHVNPIPVGFEITSFRQTLIWLKVHLINETTKNWLNSKVRQRVGYVRLPWSTLVYPLSTPVDERDRHICLSTFVYTAKVPTCVSQLDPAAEYTLGRSWGPAVRPIVPIEFVNWPP